MHTAKYYRRFFQECVLNRVASVDVGEDQPMPLTQIRRHLKRCNDIMPALLCDELDVPRGSTYADGVRASRNADMQAEEI